MTQDVKRAGLRTMVVLLAVGLVIAATIALTPRFDRRLEDLSGTLAAKTQMPSPASVAALHQAISEAQSGVPDYDRAKAARAQLVANFSLLERAVVAIEGGIPVQTDATLLAAARRQQQALAKLGPQQSVAYLGGEGGRFDRYRVTFRNGALLWFIALGKDGKLENYDFDTVGIPTPQNYIDNYAQFPWGARSGRLATQLAILLGVAMLGRWVLRLRL